MNNGGPAYPQLAIPGVYSDPYPGMSLRDWFAGMALCEQIERHIEMEKLLKDYPPEISALNLTKKRVALACYQYADAMLEQRDKKS